MNELERSVGGRATSTKSNIATTFFAESYFATQPELLNLEADREWKKSRTRDGVFPLVPVPAVGTPSIPPVDTISISSSRVIQAQTQDSPYHLRTSNYLTRLRSTCSLWVFLHVGIAEQILEKEVVRPPKPLIDGDTQETPSLLTTASPGSQPASTLPPASE